MHKFDIYHFHDVFIIPHILLSILLRLFKKPYIVSTHGILDPVRLEKNKVAKVILLPLVRFMLSGAKYLVATSKKEEEDLRSLGFQQVKTIYNGIATEKSKNNKKFESLKNKSKLTLLFVGKLHPQKGLLSFLKAMKQVNRNDIRLLIAGIDDGDELRLKEFVSNHSMHEVSFLGYVNEQDKQSLYEISDCFIHPSDSEGFSISILEALNNSLPVLITDACNFDEVQSYNAGTVMPKNNVETIAKSLKEITKKQLLQQKKNTNKLITDKFTIAIMACKLEKLYAKSLT